jgi:hypothetical protein
MAKPLSLEVVGMGSVSNLNFLLDAIILTNLAGSI